MMTFRLVGILAVSLAAPALGQAPGLPVINSGVARGVTLGAMVGFPNAAAGDGTAYGVTGSIGFRRMAVGAVVSGLDRPGPGDAIHAVGGNLTYKLLGGPLVPLSVNLQAGAAYYTTGGGGSTGSSHWHIPVGLGISWTIPQPVVALRPWLAPRIDHARLTAPALMQGGPRNTNSSTDFGLSGGVTLGFLNGFGIDLAFDRVFADGPGSKPTTIGIGASINLK